METELTTQRRTTNRETQCSSLQGPLGHLGSRSGLPRGTVSSARSWFSKFRSWLLPTKPHERDQGSALVELASVTILAAAVLVAVYSLGLSQTFNDGVRQMVCLIEGPSCGEETWVDADRPDAPEEYEWGQGNSNRPENESTAMEMADAHGWGDGSEWACLQNLWSNTSGFDHTFQDGESGDLGIPGYNASRHSDYPISDGFQNSASTQISWGLDYISDKHGTPCVAWANWQNSHAY